MSVEIGVSIFVAVVAFALIVAIWRSWAHRAPFVRELELHYQSLDGTPRTKTVPIPKRERHQTPKQTAKATRKR